MVEASADFQRQFNDFEAFKTRFPTLYELRMEFEEKDIGLHRAVALAVLDFTENEAFPVEIIQQEREIEHFFGMVDDAKIARRKIINVTRSKRNPESASVFVNMVENWKRSPETVKARKRNAIEVLIAFHYLTHHVTDDDGAPQPYYWARIVRGLVPEDEMQRRRAAHFEAKNTGQSKKSSKRKQARSSEVQSPKESAPTVVRHDMSQTRITTERLQQLRDRLIGKSERRKLYYRLDYSDQDNAFKFDPETFRHSSDEQHLDDVLIELSIIGGMIERSEATVLDLIPLRAIINVFMGSAEIDGYLDWLITPEEMPDDVSFLGAVNLYEQLGNEVTGGLARYRENALRIIDDKLI